MNENAMTIRLRDYMESSDGWGNTQGRELHQKLLGVIEANPGKKVIRVSLEGVERTDASFPRESVVELARRYRGQKGFCLIGVGNQDLLDNWDAAALKRGQPLLVWEDDGYQIIGAQPTRGNRPLLDYVLSVPKTTATDAAKALGLKLTNASTKLKQLLDGGFMLRREEMAPSGGIEYVYFRIK